ncbi:hypothetical protein D9M70_438140 [compost metagenome]
MAGVRGDHQAIVVQRLHGELGGGGQHRHERHVELAGAQRGQQLLGHPAAQAQLRRRSLTQETAAGRDDQRVGKGRRIAEPDHALLAGADAAHFRERIVEVATQLQRPLQEQLPGLRRAHALRQALEQRDAQIALDPAHRLGQCRLGHAQRFGGLADRAVLADAEDIFEIASIQGILLGYGLMPISTLCLCLTFSQTDARPQERPRAAAAPRPNLQPWELQQ